MESNPLPIASNDTSPSSMHREAARGSDAATLSEIEGARPSQGYASATCPTAQAHKAPAGKITMGTAGETAPFSTLYLGDAMLGDVLPFPVDAAIEQRLRAGSPKAGARHVRINDDPMIGENMWASDEPRVHWTTYPLTIAGVCVALIFVGQLARSFLAGVLS